MINTSSTRQLRQEAQQRIAREKLASIPLPNVSNVDTMSVTKLKQAFEKYADIFAQIYADYNSNSVLPTKIAAQYRKVINNLTVLHDAINKRIAKGKFPKGWVEAAFVRARDKRNKKNSSDSVNTSLTQPQAPQQPIAQQEAKQANKRRSPVRRDTSNSNPTNAGANTATAAPAAPELP